MLIPGKSHSGSRDAIPRSQSRLSISPEYVTSASAGVIGVGSPAGREMGRERGDRGLADDRPSPFVPPQTIWLRSLWSPMPGPIAACERSIDSGRWHARNVAKQLKERDQVSAMAIGRWTIGRRRGRMDAWNGGQRSGLWCHGTPVETQAGNAIADWPPGTGNPQARCGMRPDNRPTSRLWTVIFPVSYIEADWSGRICTARPTQWSN